MKNKNLKWYEIKKEWITYRKGIIKLPFNLKIVLIKYSNKMPLYKRFLFINKEV